MEAHLILNENHEYFLNNKKIDGLTATLKEAGLIRNNDPFYTDRGMKIHLATEYYDRGTLDEDNLDPQIKPYLASWKRFRKDTNYTPTYIEFQTYHPELMVGMTIDRLPGPLDLKSGISEPWHILQVGFQWGTLVVHNPKGWVSKPMDVYLDPDGGPPKVKIYKSSELREAFKVYASMLYFIRWRRDHK